MKIRVLSAVLVLAAATPVYLRADTQTDPGSGAPAVASPAESVSAPAADAATGPAAEPSAEGAAVLFPQQEEAPVPVIERSQDTLSIDFPDEEIRTVLRNVADLFDLNLVIPDTLVGRTSIKLRNVTWRQIFTVILSPVGYSYTEEGNIIKVVSNALLLQEPVATEVFILNYARATEVQPVVNTLVEGAAGGRIQVDHRSNALVITERPSRMNRIRAIIEKLDKPTDQVMIETKFIEVTNKDTKDLGVNWASMSKYQINAGPFDRQYTKDTQSGTSNRQTANNNQSVNSASSNTSSSSSSTSNGMSYTDKTTEDGTLTSTLTNTLSTSGASSLGNTASNGVTSAVQNLSNVVSSAAMGKIDTAVFNSGTFSVLLSALTSTNLAQLVSNPTVVTLNNTEATINIGEEFPVPSYTYNQERGIFEVSGFEYKPIGILLKVTPQVNNAGFINLKIQPEVSVRNGTTNFGGAGGAELPIIATRKTITNLSIKDGYTLAIGGLVERSMSDENTKVPLLGDIPGLGRLFQSKNKIDDTRNLIIFITAKTLSPEGSTYADVISERMMYDMGLTPADIPGYRLSDEQRALYQDYLAKKDAAEREKFSRQLGKSVGEAVREEKKESSPEGTPASRPGSSATSRRR